MRNTIKGRVEFNRQFYKRHGEKHYSIPKWWKKLDDDDGNELGGNEVGGNEVGGNEVGGNYSSYP